MGAMAEANPDIAMEAATAMAEANPDAAGFAAQSMADAVPEMAGAEVTEGDTCGKCRDPSRAPADDSAGYGGERTAGGGGVGDRR